MNKITSISFVKTLRRRLISSVPLAMPKPSRAGMVDKPRECIPARHTAPNPIHHLPRPTQMKILLTHIAAAAAFTLIAAATQAQTLPPPPVSPAPTTQYEYNPQGSPTRSTQAPGAGNLNLSTTRQYDTLNRVQAVIDAQTGITTLSRDGQDRVTKLTDPRNLATQYNRNGLGDTTQLVSPDTGTANQTFDAAGNLITRTDSRGVLSSYVYDAKNRLTIATHSQAGKTSEIHSWVYDQVGPGFSYGKGRLTSTSFPAGSTQMAHDPWGEVITQTQTVNAATGANATAVISTVSYGYTLSKLTSITYPSGRKLVLTRTGGQVTAVGLAKDTGATTAVTPLLSNIQWEPFGPPSSWNWELSAGPQPYARIYDLSGRIVRLRLGDVIRDITYDAADRITKYTHYNATTAAATPTLDQTFAYDTLSRIQSVTTATTTWTITYDANGNRTQVSQSGTARNYITPATSNKLSSLDNPVRAIAHDAAGNRVADQALFSTTFNLANRLSTLTRSGATTTYHYDNEGRRIRKFTSAGAGAGSASTVIFVYDKEGQLLGEYTQTGQAIREYVWFENLPVAMFTPDPVAAANPPLVYFIHPDHLNTPRTVVDKANKIRWRWLAEPFGTTAPETNPSALGVFTQPLRFPGQYADAESTLFYNWNRYYDPTTGRYVESDPIGLAGGLNTFSYALNQPTKYTDSNGLFPFLILPGICAAGGCEALIGTGIVLMSPPGQKAIKDGANAIGEACSSKDDADNCEIILDKGQLKFAGIRGREHEVKGDELGTNKNLSKFDLCGCKDGRVVVKMHGCKGPIISITGHRWK